MPRIVTIVGSLSGSSRTRQIAETLQKSIINQIAAEHLVVDVGELLPELVVRDRASANVTLKSALDAIEAADLIIASTPVYKGSYTGMFKHLIDLLDFKSLSGVPVALLAVGGSERHALVVEHQLRPLFAAFNAATLPTGVFVLDKTIEAGRIIDPAVSSRLQVLIQEAVAALQGRVEAKLSAARTAA
jgi:FMN reductase